MHKPNGLCIPNNVAGNDTIDDDIALPRDDLNVCPIRILVATHDAYGLCTAIYRRVRLHACDVLVSLPSIDRIDVDVSALGPAPP